MSRKITLKEVADRSTEKPGLIVIDKKVYDITDYMSKHPGGDDILTEVLGQDATEAFHEVGHSEDAKEQLKPLYVGELDYSVEDQPATKLKSAGVKIALPRGVPQWALVFLVMSILAIVVRLQAI